jgi:hypothetical protein
MGSRSTRSASIAIQGAPFAAPCGALAWTRGEVRQAESSGKGLRAALAAITARAAIGRRLCCISTLRDKCHPREGWDPAVGHDEATTYAEKSTRATKSDKPHSVVVSWMLANANREREHDPIFVSTACVRLSAPTRLEAPKDFQQMRRAATALNFDWRDSAECYDAPLQGNRRAPAIRVRGVLR